MAICRCAHKVCLFVQSLKEALADERKYLQRHYPALADKNGTEYLARALSEKLGDHIKKCIPELKVKGSAARRLEHKALATFRYFKKTRI